MAKKKTTKKTARSRKAAEGNGRAGNGANLGFEQKLWQAADKMRGHMDAAEYKHVALGLIFLKYISDAFEATYQQIQAGEDEYAAAGPGDPEDRDEYQARNVFWVPPEARWSYLQKNAKQTNVGKLIDDAMVAIERDNRSLKGVLPKEYSRPALDRHRLGELIDLIATIALTEAGGDAGKAATLDQIRSHGHVLTPRRYVGAEEAEDDDEPFEEKMPRLVAQLNEQFAESQRLEQKIRSNLADLGYEGATEVSS